MNDQKEKKNKEIKWKIISAIGLTGTAAFGTLYFVQSGKFNEANETAQLVKKVVGGPLIERLIKNEELKLARTDNKIANIKKNNITKEAEKVLKEHMEHRDNIIETIADFVDVRDALNK